MLARYTTKNYRIRRLGIPFSYKKMLFLRKNSRYLNGGTAAISGLRLLTLSDNIFKKIAAFLKKSEKIHKKVPQISLRQVKRPGNLFVARQPQFVVRAKEQQLNTQDPLPTFHRPTAVGVACLGRDNPARSGVLVAICHGPLSPSAGR
jgi:hypothetical protein